MAGQAEENNNKSSNMVSSSGFCYSDVSSTNPTIQAHLMNPIQSFESNSELFNLTTNMELIGFPPKNHLQHQHHQQNDGNTPVNMWKGFFNKPDFTAGLSESTTDNLMVAPESSSTWQDNRLIVDDSSLRCVFPCEGNERPSQGLSLSLCSSNPSTIGLQSFELRPTNNSNNPNHDIRFISPNLRDGFAGKAANLSNVEYQLRNSKYLGPAQELLNEFCSLGTKQSDLRKVIKNPNKTNQWEEENGSTSSSKKQTLYALDLLDLQKRKSKLLSMLEEVDRRYRHYCDQMKAVVSSFEAIAGNGAAKVYSALASKAMSKHFRCLRDGIVGQIQETKKAMGEKDTAAPGMTKGETPRLRLLDQTLRQQRAFQQMSMMESHPWRPQRGLPERSVSVLRAWLFEHFLHPYPSDVDKHILARQTGLSRSQVSNWFINARVRLWKPMVEEMYLEETKEEDDNNNMASSEGVEENDRNNPQARIEDQKPTQDQLVRIDSECLSSIINNNPDNKTDPKPTQNHHFGSFGAMELDFSSYNHQTTGGASYTTDGSHQNYAGPSGGGVSLTLGLQQHGGSRVSLAFSPVTQNSLFFPREHMEDCQPVQYSLLDGEAQNLPYRNLMGAQLLHDLAG